MHDSKKLCESSTSHGLHLFVLFKKSYIRIAHLRPQDQHHPSHRFPPSIQNTHSNHLSQPPTMGCTSSKPSKSKPKARNPPRKSQVSKPAPHPAHLPPTADRLPKHTRSKPIPHPSHDPWPHHPRPVYVSPEDELRERVRRFQAPKPVHGNQARGNAAVRVTTGNVKAKPSQLPANTKKQAAAAAASQPKQPYQFKPLNEIGAPRPVKARGEYGMF